MGYEFWPTHMMIEDPLTGRRPFKLSDIHGFVDAREFGFRKNDTGEQVSGSFVQAFAQMESGQTLLLPQGTHLVDAGASTKKRIGVIGCGAGTRVLWRPAIAGSTLLSWTNASASVSDLNEEGNLDSVSVGKFIILGDRATRANGLQFTRCDWVDFERIVVMGLAGSSLRVNNCREFFWDRFRTRYNGYVDYTNFDDSVDDVWIGSPDGGVDTSNFWTGTHIWLAYSLSNHIRFDNADQMCLSSIHVHDLPEGSTTLEANFVNRFGGAAGFVGGVAQNDYAKLHQHSTGNETSVSGLTLSGVGKARTSIKARACQNLRISCGTIRGGRTNALIWADAASEVHLSNLDIQAGNASTTVSGTVTFDAGTDVATVGTIAFPQTGEPVRFTTTGSLPAELTAGTTYYAIRTGASTGKLATTLLNAEAGTPINLSGAGTGTHTMHSIQGYAIRATGGSKVWIDSSVSLDDCRQATYHDGTSGHNIYGVPRLGGTWSDLANQTQPFVVGPSLASGPGILLQDTSSRKLGFFGGTPGAKPTVSGSRGSNAALADLLTELATLGLITDSTS